MVQLDGLRAIAVAMVVLFHWTPEVKQLALGGLGVQLFFVLSGYLITGILLDARTKAEKLSAGTGQIIKSFYARRFLRIFPLYYLVIGLTFLLGAANVQLYLPWHLAYLTNIAIFLQGDWIGEASHLWSLAVEEQFYLFWPFVILFTPKRYLTSTVLMFILLAPVFKLTCGFLGVGGSRLGVLPVSSFHYLGAGALLAILEKSHKYKNNPYWRKAMATRIKLAGIAGLAVFLVLRMLPGTLLALNPFVDVLQEFAVISLFVSITMGAALGYKGIAGRFLSAKPMVYIGQISYGLYLLHNFVPLFTLKLLRYLGINASETLGTDWLLLIYTLVLFAVSAFLWHFFERKLNKYKKHFPYVKAKEAQGNLVASQP